MTLQWTFCGLGVVVSVAFIAAGYVFDVNFSIAATVWGWVAGQSFAFAIVESRQPQLHSDF